MGDPFLNATLLATVELIGVLCSQFAYEKIGRKIPYTVNMMIAGVTLLVVYFIPKCDKKFFLTFMQKLFKSINFVQR